MKYLPGEVPDALPEGLAAIVGSRAGRGAGTQPGTLALERPHPPGLPLVGSWRALRFPTPLTQRLKKLKCEWGLETECPNGKGGVQGGGRESEEERVKRSELKKEERDSKEEREREEERKDRKEKKQQMSPPPYRADVGAWQHHDRRGTSAGSQQPQRPESRGENHDPQAARQQPDDSAPWWRGEGG